MGRIDEALKRASGKAVSAGDAAAERSQFVSAWGDEPAVTPVAPPASTGNGVAKTAQAVEPVLVSTQLDGALSALARNWGERLVCAPTCSPSVVEQFRGLAAVLHKAQSSDRIKVVMVTSAMPRDGKTLTAINLALALSDSYKRRVLLVDADLRCPAIGKASGLNGSSGLSECLKASSEEKLAVVPLSPTLTLLPGGAPDPDPMSSLTSLRMRRILEEAVARFDWVIVDAPPVGPVADAHLLAEMVDTTILVVRAAQTQFPFVQKAIETLGRERLLGVVLNAVEDSVSEDYKMGYHAATT